MLQNMSFLIMQQLLLILLTLGANSRRILQVNIVIQNCKLQRSFAVYISMHQKDRDVQFQGPEQRQSVSFFKNSVQYSFQIPIQRMLLAPIIIILISYVLPPAYCACSVERCCNTSPCTQTYCTSKNSQTWISTQNYATYGYTKLVLSSGSCLPCSYNCQVCASETSCTTCASGFYMSGSTCILCGYMCSSCVVTNSISKCSVCSGATFLASSTAACSNCPSGASACSSSTVISACLTGYYLTQNSLFCLACPSNCASCPSSNSVCSSCRSGYYLNSSNCYVCTGANCLTCTFAAGKQMCLSCVTGYYLASGSCSACGSNCNRCTASACSTCARGYYMVAGGCLPATTAIDNCNTYLNAGSCSTCVSGFFLSNALCVPCSVLCTACSGIHFGVCTACVSSATLFNQQCLPNNYLSNTQYQLYYSFPASAGYLTSGSPDCNNYLYSGTTLSLTLNNLAASSVTVTWKIFSVGGSTTYSASWSNSASSNTAIYATSSSQYQAFPLCSSSPSSLYYLHQATLTISSVKVNNTLTFSTNNNVVLALQQVLVVATSCNSLCAECSSVLCTQCLMTNLYTQNAYCVYSCSSGYYLYYNSSSTNNLNSCVQSCPVNTFALSTNLTCAQCSAPCLSCLNQNFCLSCIGSYYLTQLNTCLQICPFQYFGESSTQSCQKCMGRCNECLSQTQCLNCLTGFYYAANYSCLDNCFTGITGMYADLATLKCLGCSADCQNCLYSSIYCTSCVSGRLFYNNTCLSACPSGYYVSSGVCLACSYPCEGCSQSASNCSSCSDRYLLANTCVSACPGGYFEDNSALACTPCLAACAQCTSSSSYCLQCNAGYYLFNNTCMAVCPGQYYPDAGSLLCQPCVGYCYTCSNSSYCTSCNTNFLLNGSCLTASSCPAQYYADIAQLACLPCSAVCLTCQYKATLCTSCRPNSSLPLLQNSSCVSACTLSTTYAGATTGGGACLACIAPCLACANSSYCLSCQPGYMLSGGSCSTSCAAAYFFNSATVNCQPCSAACLACSSSSFCQTCQTAFYILPANSSSNQCVGSCGATYYASTVESTCRSCLYPCSNCSSAVNCLSCQEGALYLSRCLATCPDTTFLNSSGMVCSACAGKCLTCSQAATHCLTCQTGYYLSTLDNTCSSACPAATYAENVTQMCLQCPSSCSACSNSTSCLACVTNRTYLYAPTSVCLSSCPLGFFANTSATACNSCASKCLTCSGSSANCLSCAANYYLIQLSVSAYDCVTACAQGYYTQSQNCESCVFPCQTCASAIACTTCVVGTYFYANTSACLLSCPSNAFVNTAAQSCQLCTSPCASCLTATYCLSCISNLYLLNGKCLSTCPLKYYSDTTQICTQCTGLCSTCSSKFYCLSCLTGYLSNGYCYNSCPPGTFANVNVSACQPCLSPCLECTFSTSYCTLCTGALVVYQGSCASACPTGTYLSGGTCLACSFPCVSCLGAQSCQACLGGYLLYNSLTCINYTLYCPNDLYKKDSTACIPLAQCPSNYFTDPALRTCSSSCVGTKYTQPNNKTCVYACESYQYVGVGMVCQNYSASPPASLMGMTAIAFIKSNIINVVFIFNQTPIWLNPSNPYTLTTSTSRLLQTATTLNYSLNSGDPTTLILKVVDTPAQVGVLLPASNLVAAGTNYPLQTPNLTLFLPSFVPYDYETIYQGLLTSQFGFGLGWFILLLSLFYLFHNRISHLYTLWDTVQLLYVVILLDIQYPPALNQFLRGLNTTLFLSFPNLFPVGATRTVSAPPFYAYTYDNNFLRNAGPALTLGFMVLVVYLVFKSTAELARRWEGVRECLGNYPKVKRFMYQTLLRFRWHYASDVFFLTYISVYLFGVTELLNIGANPNRGLSNAFCVVMLVVYLAFPIFAGVKLHRHFPNIRKGKHSENLRCFYRGIDKTSQFGVFLIMIRYFRKLVYALVIAVFSEKPMFALPILMFTSVLMGLFIFLKLPFKKRLSNVVEIINQCCIALLFLGMALINFNNEQAYTGFNVALGYVCTGLLILILLLLVFEVFCRSLFHLKSEEEIRKENEKKVQNMSESELRRRAGEFFDYMFPRIRKEFGLGEDSDQEGSNRYEEGDSQDSENNIRREEEWDIRQSEAQSDQFRHYGSESEEATDAKAKAPQYLIRCVKEIK